MSTKVYVAVVAIVAIVVFLAVLFSAGEKVNGGEPHKCLYSTNINDLFCKEK